MDLLQNIQVTSHGQLEGQNICNSTATKFHQWVQTVKMYLSFIVKLLQFMYLVFILRMYLWWSLCTMYKQVTHAFVVAFMCCLSAN